MIDALILVVGLIVGAIGGRIGSFAGKAIVRRMRLTTFGSLLDAILIGSGLSLRWAPCR